MNFKAVIFELDGTLLDSLKGITDAINILLTRMQYPVHTLDTYKYFVGDGIKELVRRSLPTDWDEQFNPKDETKIDLALDELVKEFRTIYDETWPQQSPPYAGVLEMLTLLSQSNIDMAVLSNKSDDFTKRMVTALLPNIPFKVVLGTRPGIPRKPHPDSALEIVQIFGVQPQETLFLGDTSVDMQTAQNAGMVPLGALWGFRTAEELLKNGAKALLRQPLDLMDIIGKN